MKDNTNYKREEPFRDYTWKDFVAEVWKPLLAVFLAAMVTTIFVTL